MAQSIKILGQLAPAATTLGTIYSTPGTITTAISSVAVCNRGGAATTFRISAAIANAADGTAQYLYYDTPISSNDTFVATMGITLGTSDVLRGYAGNGSITFMAFGAENS